MKKFYISAILILSFFATIFSQPCFAPYQADTEYYTGSQVSYLGRNYRANWTTREVPGQQNWGGWESLGACQEETLIDLSVPQEKESVRSVSQFLLFAAQNLILNSGVTIVGNIGANGSVAVGNTSAGWQTTVNGDIYSKDSVTTTAQAQINGDVYAQNLQLGWEAKHNGEQIRNRSFDFSVAQKAVSYSGGSNVRGDWKDTIKLSAGNHRNVSVRDGGGLILSKGTYNLKSLSFNSAWLPLILDIAPGETVELNIADSIRFGSSAGIKFSGKTSPLSFKIHTNQTSDLVLPDHAEINAIITAPNAKVIVNSSAKINGAIFAREIEVLAGAMINSVPFITDIFHSEYNFAPEFDINTTEYFSVIDVNSTIDFVEAITPERYKITTYPGYKYLFEVEDTATKLVSYYTIIFDERYNPAVFVNANASASGSGEDWTSAVKTLQEAIVIAKKTGKEIRVAQGTYESVTIGQGIKIVGGFLGSEVNEEPLGSPYRTIITGRNEKTALTINGFSGAKSVKIKGISVENGFSELSGGGISSQNVMPKFEEIAVRNNVSSGHGAGIYAPKGVQDLQMVLVESNTGTSAFYIGNAVNNVSPIKAERMVISQNSGDGLRTKNADISFVNSIFYGNDRAIFAENSDVEIIHCTFAKNGSGISGENSNVKIVNTILWNENGQLSGDGFDVSFSCVRGGFSGEGNIDEDPMFVNVENAKGGDGIWGTFDDGLRVKDSSPCIDKGSDGLGVELDIRDNRRPLNGGFDIGAYEISVLLNGESVLDLGILNFKNEFIIGEGIGDFALDVSSKKDLYKKMHGRSALTIRLFAEKNKHVEGISDGKVSVWFEKDGEKLSEPIEMTFYRNGQTSSHFVFTSRKFVNGKFEGKPVFLVANADENKINALKDDRYHVFPVFVGEDIRLKSIVFTKQFR